MLPLLLQMICFAPEADVKAVSGQIMIWMNVRWMLRSIRGDVLVSPPPKL
ncbi:hypothetical protein LPH55_06000 [Xylella taiwanensis]|uniref:Transposase n=1 Tax=Xylella taiwanensis TaxID=1444770 RepID=A0ABS8TVU6_9GAMM|nr:hypothetical protein [Xylella taiwanensis]MCD8473025.1 hypothetical protein [Xylella taiwanensis]